MFSLRCTCPYCKTVNVFGTSDESMQLQPVTVEIQQNNGSGPVKTLGTICKSCTKIFIPVAEGIVVDEHSFKEKILALVATSDYGAELLQKITEVDKRVKEMESAAVEQILYVYAVKILKYLETLPPEECTNLCANKIATQLSLEPTYVALVLRYYDDVKAKFLTLGGKM